jgi:DNA-binding transcriptional regulator YiaG
MTAKEQRREYVLSVISKFPSQSAAAEAMGIEQPVVNRWACGVYSPSPIAVRCLQLLEELRERGIEAPPPLSF